MTGFIFRPSLLENRTRAMEILEAAGFRWFANYSSIDLDHTDNFMEVCGIQDYETAQAIGRVIHKSFAGCRCSVWYKDYGREQAWQVDVYLP
jgi:hypothetical protein